MTAPLGADNLQTVRGFSGPQVCSIVGIPYRQLDYWCRTKLIEPTGRPSSGSGAYRDYSERDVLLLATVKALIDGGVSLQRARTAIAALDGREFEGAHLVLVGTDTFVAYDGTTIVDLLRSSHGILTIVSLDVARAALGEALDAS